MRTKLTIMVLLLFNWVMTSSAHHSHAAFDISKWITVEGTITQVNWTNPHVLVFMDGKRIDETDKTTAVGKWILENPGIPNLVRAGWERDTITVGAKVIARGHWSAPPVPWDEVPEERAGARETLALVEAAIERLPAAQREVITLRDVEGWTSEEVCHALELSETNQRVLLHRARSKVRRALEEHVEKKVGRH